MIKNQKHGFTLIEVIMVIAIFAIVMGALMNFIIIIYRSQSYSLEQAVAVNEARRGIETMVQEIRQAQTGDDGSYIIEKANDKEFVFYSDIDSDGDVERVRYFLGGYSSGSLTNQCVTFISGGSCGVSFSDFFTGTIESAQITAGVEGDFGNNSEYADINVDSVPFGRVCQSGCNDCAGVWQGSSVYDVTSQAQDNFIGFLADASSQVNNFCDWEETNHSMKAKFELVWTENFSTGQTDFQKGVIEPVGWPTAYPPENEQISVLSRYVRNVPPIFRYFNKDGDEITTIPARPEETTLMRVFLIINVDPSRAPNDFELESDTQIRNLKTNL